MKKKVIIGNWKLNGSIKTISYFLEYFQSNISSYLNKNTVVIAPPTIYLERVYKYIRNTKILLGAQDVDINKTGAFTGETSILMLSDIGVKYVIIGHSERRMLHYENNIIISKKFALVKKNNLIPILCIGENEREKNTNQTKKVLIEQISVILNLLGERAFENTIIAYEPIWAIGTGLFADPKYVQFMHEFIKNYIKKYNSNILNTLLVQYGGSINASNAKNFFDQPDVDGLLIGSASLNVEEFIKIIKISNDY